MASTSKLANPFPGLRPFTFDEYHLFFGREGQSDALLARLRRHRFVAVVGTSGSGKSSLIRAGVLPALYGGFMTHAGSSWRVAVMRPGNDPIGHLARALHAPDVFDTEDEHAVIRQTLTETALRRSTLGLLDVVQQAGMLPHENLLIVVDQFEELFRFKQLLQRETADDEAAAFVNLLLEATRQAEVPIYVVLTMRSDYLGDCAQFRDLPEAINDGQYLIPRLTRDQLRLAVTGPVAVGGATIASRLVHRLLNDVGDNPDQLPILQHALMRLWDYWAQHNAPTELLDLSHYEAIGGMTEALSRHADEAYEELPGLIHTVAQDIRVVAQKLFQCLTEKGPDNREIRRPTTLQEVCAVAEVDAPVMRAIIEHFRRPGRSFLMPPADVSLTPETVLDISHESLTRLWQRLQMWVDEEAQSAQGYRRLAETAVLHEAGQAGLWRDPDLHLALEWRARQHPNAAWAQRYHVGFGSAMAFLEKSEQAHTAEVVEREAQQRQTLRRTRLFAALLSVAFLLALGAGWYANEQRKHAEERTLEVQTIRWRELNRRLREITDTVKGLLPGKPVEALGQAIRATGRSLKEHEQVFLGRSWLTPRDRELWRRLEENKHVLRVTQASLMQAVRQAREQNVFKGHAGPVRSVAFSPDGRRIVSGSEDGQLRVWDFVGSHIGCGSHANAVTSVAWSLDNQTIASGGADRVVRLWDLDGRPQGQPLGGLQDTVMAVAISPDSKLLAAGSADASVTLWDLATRQPIATFTGHAASVTAVTFNPNGTLLASASDDHTVKLWNVASHTESATLIGHKTPVHTVAFSPDGRLLASGNGLAVLKTGVIKIWDVTTSQEIASFTDRDRYGMPIFALAFSPDGRHIVGGSGGVGRLWNITQQVVSQTFVGHEGDVTSVAFSRDGTFVSGGTDGTIRLWDTTPLPYETPFNAGGRMVNWITLSPDGSRLLSAGDDLRLWDSEGRLLVPPFQHQGLTTTIATFSPYGQLIASGDDRGTIQLWNLQGQPVGPPFTGHTGAVWGVAFSPDGQRIVSGGQDGTIQLWNLQGQPVGPPFTGHTGAVWGVAFSPDGQRIVSGGADKTVRVWDPQGRSLGQTFAGHTDEVQAVVFSPDGKAIVSGSLDGTIGLWDLQGTLRRQFSPEKSAIKAIDVSPDGKHIVSGGADGVVRLWDLEGHITHQFQTQSEVWTVRFSPYGQRVALGGMGDTFYLWRWDVGWKAGLQAACERLRWHPFARNVESEEAQEIRDTCKEHANVIIFQTTAPSVAPDCPAASASAAPEPEFRRGVESQ